MNTRHRTNIAPAGKTIPAHSAALRRSALAAAVAAVFALPAALPVGGLAATALVALAALPQAAQADWLGLDGSSGGSPVALINAAYIKLAIAPPGSPDAGRHYVAYADNSLGTKISVKKFNGSSWVAVGSAGFSVGEVEAVSLAIAPDGTPYVAYIDYSVSHKATVMKFDGTDWVVVGSTGFSSAYSSYTSLAIASDGTPYVAYKDGNNINQASVMKFDGTNWVAVGSPEFSTGGASYLSLAIAPGGSPDAGKPYLTYSDAALNGKPAVWKFNGANWVSVGTEGFAGDVVSDNSLAFAADGTPYVAYMDYAYAGKATVKKFDGSDWVTVGSAGFSAGGAPSVSLALAPNGMPYVAYVDSSTHKTDVKKFDSTNWVTVGSAGFSSQWSGNTSLAIAANGTPYVAFQDGLGQIPSVKSFFYGAILASSVPADNATNVAPGSTIVLTFSAATSIGGGNFKIVNDSDSTTETIDVTAPGSAIFDWNGNTLTITPGTGLVASKNYHVEIDAGTFLNAANEPYAGIADATTLNFGVSAASTAPNPPTGVTVTAGGGQGSVAFTPGSNGGSAITGYSVSCTSSNGGAAGSGSGSSSPIVVTGLTAGKDYTCTVTATNGIGASSASSASTSVTVLSNAVAVSSISDSGVGSLRQALLDVAAGGAITFESAIANQTITLASTLTISKSVTIDGGSQKITVDGNNAVRVLSIADGATVTLQKLTIANGNDATNGGGGIRNGNGTLTLNQVTLSGNAGTGAGGGGLYNASGAVTISNSLFTGNSASDGGGLRISGGTLSLTNVTFSGNSATGSGGALWAGSSAVTVNNVTLANNTASSGAGISNQGAPIGLKNTLIAANTGGNCAGAPSTNVGYNLDDGTSCGFGSSNNSQSSADPLLGVLSDNGGYTQTLSLGAGSPAINVGNNATCAATDQRGVSRALSIADACDIGAFESVAASVLSGGSVTPSASGASVSVTLSTPATLYWLLAPAGSFKPADANEIKDAVTGTTYVCDGPSPAASGNGFAAGLCSASVLTSGQVVVATAGGAASITLSGLAASTSYILYGVAQDAYGTYSVVGNANFTTTAASSAPSGGNDYTPPAPSNPTLPSGGGTVAPTSGQTVTVTDNGKEGSTIDLPSSPTGTGGGNDVKVNLPGSGTITANSTSAGSKLGVTQVTLPGSTTPVTTVTVDSGSATFTASKSGQAMAGLKNGIVVVSGTDKSQVTVDVTGANARIGVANSDTLIVPTGAQNVSGTSVDLPAPTTGGAGKPVNVSVGGKEISIQASQPNTSMTFKVVDIGGVKTPVVEVTGAAQVSSSGDNQPIVSVGGNVIKTGKSGGSSQVCNTIIQASSDSSSDAVHVVTCYIVLDAGSFSGLGGGGTGTGNNFAAIKDGIVWAGETAEFDKNGVVTSAYLGTRPGDTDAVGDDMAPGGNKFAANGYQVGAFIPRIAGTPLRLNGAKLDERIFNTVNNALGVTTQPATPTQSDQGVLNFTFNGGIHNQGVTGSGANVTYTITSDTASILPSRRIRVDTSRADGVSIGAEGDVEVATGGLITTFAPSLADPKAFADSVSQVLPGAATTLRWNGSWQVDAADGTTYVGRPQWSYWSAAPGAETFSSTADGNVLYSDNGRAQPLFPDFYDYDALQGTFRNALNDPTLTVLPRMDGTAVATVNGQSYVLAPQWNVFKPAADKPAWWVEGDVVYIKNADGTAQGFTVK